MAVFVCIDVDECEEGTAECHTNATCTNNDGSYNCSCVYGYIGDGWNCTSIVYYKKKVVYAFPSIFSIGINLCEVGPTDCHTNATCLDRDGGYDCECNDGYTGNGTYCEGWLFMI